MFKITVKTSLPEQLRTAGKSLKQDLNHMLRACGVYIRAEQSKNFENKSRGGGGVDGQAWRPLTQTTERLKQDRVIAKTRKGDESALTAAEKLKALKKRRATRKRLAKKTGPYKRSQIGVDKGLLRGSLQDGYRGDQVALEYKREYAGHFDKERPLFPDTAPPEWVAGIDRIVRQWIDDKLKNVQ